MSDKYGYIGIETLLNYCQNSVDHAITPNVFMRMNRVKMPTVERPHGEWVEVPKYKGFYACSKCLEGLDGDFGRFDHWEMRKENFCPVCGSDNRPKIHGCSFASKECEKNPCADCGLKEGDGE